jgi:hypothetical protein
VTIIATFVVGAIAGAVITAAVRADAHEAKAFNSYQAGFIAGARQQRRSQQVADTAARWLHPSHDHWAN